MIRTTRVAAAVLVALSLAPVRGDGQERFVGSSYLPLDHWAYPYLDLLLARGRLTDLPVMVRPYRRADVARSLTRVLRSGRVSGAEERWAREVLDALGPEARELEGGDQELRMRGEFSSGLDVMTQGHRDPLRPEGDAAVFPVLDARLSGSAPNLAGDFHLRWDGHYLNDPQFPGGRAIEFRECDPLVAECAYRVEDAYVELQWPYVRLFFGRMARNWSPPGAEGFLVSDYAYSYDHLAYRFGSDRLSLSGLLTVLSDFGGDTARYFASHRFDWRLRDNLVVSGSEAVVYGGVNRRLDLNFTNPVGIWEISASSLEVQRNTLASADVWWRPATSWVAHASFLLDNTMVGVDSSAVFTQWGARVGLGLPALRPTLGVRGDLVFVNSLAYRSQHGPLENYTYQGLGLGQDKADAVILGLWADWFPTHRLTLQPHVQAMWKGSDDIRTPWPAESFYGHENLLVGLAEITVRPAVSGRWHSRRAEVAWDLGINVVKNNDHAPAGWKVKGVGRLQVRLRAGF